MGATEPRHPSRRDVLALGVGAFLVTAVPLARRRGPVLVRRSIPAMGTIGEVAVLHEDQRYGQQALSAALAEIRRAEELLTRFRPDSDVGRVNGSPRGRAVPVQEETADALADALRLADACGGAFDPCLGGATEVWDVGVRTSPPADHLTRPFAKVQPYRFLEIERGPTGPSVRLHDPRASVDLGAIGKGWGVDRAARVLRDWGVRSALVNLGGDLFALGASADGDPWRVGVRDPDRPDGVVAQLALADEAVATSGDYERFFTHQGRRFHHVLDPGTGEPVVGGPRSVTVAHARCTVADACATAALTAGPRESAGVLARMAADARIAHTVAREPGRELARSGSPSD